MADTFHYWVAFTDKKDTPFSVEYPEDYLSLRSIERRNRQNIAIDTTDLPVNAEYINAVKAVGATIVGTSKWMNGATIMVNDSTTIMPQIRALTFVKYIQLTKTTSAAPAPQHHARKKFEENIVLTKDSAFIQKHIHQLDGLHALGFRGEGIHIAVIDGGFLNVDKIEGFDSLRTDGRILGTRNFVRNTSVYGNEVHGTAVLSAMAANEPGVMVGAAPKASYWLLVSEDALTESLLETDNWVRAMEFADSVGVDVVNSSLGYSTFDDETTSWTYADMDGSTRISQAAVMAARKGMLLCISAGNEGTNPWHYITAPADADSILTVGSVTRAGKLSPFSSYGPAADGRTKPTVCAVGTDASLYWSDGSVYESNGTSFASPTMAGAVACLWQACPQLNNMELIDLIKQCSSRANGPDNTMGYGVPDVLKAYYLSTDIKVIPADSGADIYPNPFTEKLVIGVNRPVMVAIYDMLGREIYCKTIISKEEINAERWSTGVYFVRIAGERNNIVQKVVKQ